MDLAKSRTTSSVWLSLRRNQQGRQRDDDAPASFSPSPSRATASALMLTSTACKRAAARASSTSRPRRATARSSHSAGRREVGVDGDQPVRQDHPHRHQDHPRGRTLHPGCPPAATSKMETKLQPPSSSRPRKRRSSLRAEPCCNRTAIRHSHSYKTPEGHPIMDALLFIFFLPGYTSFSRILLGAIEQ